MMNPSLYLRSVKAIAAASAMALLIAAGPGQRPQNAQRGGGSQGNQQCPPGQTAQASSAGQQGGMGMQTGGGVMMAPGGEGGPGGGGGPGGQGGPDDGQNQGPGNEQNQTQGRSQNRQRQQGQTLTGTVSSYNLNPSGTPESLMLNTGNSTIQLNFPPEMSANIQSAVAVGSQVTATASSGGPRGMGGPAGMGGQNGAGGQNGPGGQGGPDDQQQADHQVMNLESIKSSTGQSINIGGPGSGQNGQTQGTVKHLNYDRRGQVDGAQLDNGTFVHLRPGGEADLTVGEKVTVEGRERTTNKGLKIIEAQTINGTAVDGNEPGGSGGNGGPNNAGGPPGGGPPGGNGGGNAPGQ